MERSFIEYQVTEGVASICLEKPADLQAATSHDRVTEYLLALQDADRDPAVKVVLSHTRASVGSVDLIHAAAVEASGPLTIPVSLARALTKPVVTLVDGRVTGLAFVLALAADVRFAATGTSFGPVGHDLTPGIARLLARSIGESRTRELLLSGRTLGADEARTIGLVHEVAPAGELLRRGRAYATAMARDVAPERLAAVKNSLVDEPPLVPSQGAW